MKTNFKKALIPFGVIVLGVVGAFASNFSKQNDSEFAMVEGYYYDITKPVAERCVDVKQWCSDIPSQYTCKDSFNRDLHALDINSGTCNTSLYRL